MAIHEDVNGNKSSKRVWGSILLSTALAMRIVLFICSILIEVKDANTAILASQTLLYTGGGLLGLGVIEHFGKKK